MTYKTLKSATKGLLVGDNVLPKDPDVVLGQLAMAYNYIANKCAVMTLMTLDNSENILRLGQGNYKVRVPELPENDEDELDIDDDLGYVAANLIAAYTSKNKKPYFMQQAEQLILIFNGKILDMQESFKLNNEGTKYDLPGV